MNSLIRQAARVPRAAVQTRVFTPSITISKRWSTQSYGGSEQSDQPGKETDIPNRRADLEHPGPPAPDTGSSNSKSSSSESKQESSSSSNSSGNKNPPQSSGEGKGSQTKDGKRPAIYEPGPAHEEATEDVKKHNDEMSQRYEKSANQLDGDGKVEKEFWSSECHVCCLSL